jgi:hypothetical protein
MIEIFRSARDSGKAHRSTKALENAIKHYVNFTNENPKPFVWTKTPDEILETIARFCQRTSGTGH